jgi:hypothetical protein
VEEGGLLTSIVDADEMNAIWEMIWGGWWSQIVNKLEDLNWIFIGIYHSKSGKVSLNF